LILSLSTLFALSACRGEQNPAPPSAADNGAAQSPGGFLAPPGVTTTPIAGDFPELDWLELMPSAEREALLSGDVSVDIDHELDGRMAQVGSAAIVAELDGAKITLPGYVVPLELTEDGALRSFFLVPYYGACIHVPPPPPNQLVYAELATPMAPPDLWEPMLLSGTLRTKDERNDMAHAAYRMDTPSLKAWEG
jgi:hypothetical protein